MTEARVLGISVHRILIIGCGSIGERHLRCFRRTGRVNVTACDADPALLQRMGETYQTTGVTDWKVAIDEGRYDAAVICTPAPLHIPMAVRALERGLHVLIEKPLSHSLQGLDELLRARDRAGRQAAVAYVLHVYPFLAEARTFLGHGELGGVRHATVTSGQPFHRFRPAYAQTYYRDHETGGGAIQDALTHTANWMESVIGPADSVLCDCAHLVLPNVVVEDTVHVSARHGGVLANYTLNQFQAPDETTLQFNTARGSVKIEFHTRRWGVFREGDTDWTWHGSPAGDRDAIFVAEANAFLDQIEGGPVRLCTVEAAGQTLRFNLAAIASAKAGTRIWCKDLHA